MTTVSLRREAAKGLAALVALGLLTIGSAAAQTGPAMVIDGDTLRVDGIDVRLWGIDAPERGQTCHDAAGDYACGERATSHLLALVAGHSVACTARGRDRYGRTIAVCRSMTGMSALPW